MNHQELIEFLTQLAESNNSASAYCETMRAMLKSNTRQANIARAKLGLPRE